MPTGTSFFSLSLLAKFLRFLIIFLFFFTAFLYTQYMKRVCVCVCIYKVCASAAQLFPQVASSITGAELGPVAGSVRPVGPFRCQ